MTGRQEYDRTKDRQRTVDEYMINVNFLVTNRRLVYLTGMVKILNLLLGPQVRLIFRKLKGCSHRMDIYLELNYNTGFCALMNTEHYFF
jgi:hypothetical protein